MLHQHSRSVVAFVELRSLLFEQVAFALVQWQVGLALVKLQQQHTSLKEAHLRVQKEVNQLKCNCEALKVGGWGLFQGSTDLPTQFFKNNFEMNLEKNLEIAAKTLRCAHDLKQCTTIIIAATFFDECVEWLSLSPSEDHVKVLNYTLKSESCNSHALDYCSDTVITHFYEYAESSLRMRAMK